MTDPEPEQGLTYYRRRMEIEERSRDLKSLLGIEQVMDKGQKRIERVLVLALLAAVVLMFQLMFDS